MKNAIKTRVNAKFGRAERGSPAIPNLQGYAHYAAEFAEFKRRDSA
jgi:hypothetical protein